MQYYVQLIDRSAIVSLIMYIYLLIIVNCDLKSVGPLVSDLLPGKNLDFRFVDIDRLYLD